MKRSDIFLIVVVAGICMIVAFFITQAVFGESATQSVKVKTIEKIDTEIKEPDTAIFNKDAINPAVEVQVGSGSQQE